MARYMEVNVHSDDLWQSEKNIFKVVDMVDENTVVKITLGRSTSETEIMHDVIRIVESEKLNYRLKLVNDRYDIKSVAILIYKEREK